ncbi:T9SS type A sorting domain-containing protein [Tamlana fucoidanivorans]|uniref:T9SS type A sorting domain-containing protein n=1 Tax=Allotamlana fucoidanivorans TaxID=2583814 RepID=A0A5C4SHM9_9FLAO|nr:T9SS type A sorting domain-containing protein [Tamlana fucoidanivorans]TNJ43197.1 T9SS type A sorting domain-containing protein [Tamlana fucoidanivorans]
MRTRLLFFLFLVPIILSAQSIDTFFSLPTTRYAVVTTSTALDQSANGENANWVFNNLMASGITSTDTYKAISPSDPEAIAFPGTNMLLTTTDTNAEEIKFYASEGANTLDVSGIELMDLTLQYDDLGLVGSFPYAYNTNNGGNSISGDFSYSGNTGTFTGILTTTVDAYGSLSMNDVGGGIYSGTITRLELIQQMELFVGIKVGDLMQTTYHYYDNTSGELVFRSTQVELTSGIIGNRSFTIMESLIMSPLSANFGDKEITSWFHVSKNPVDDVLSFYLDERVNVYDILVYDLEGKEVIKGLANNAIEVRFLEAGWYIITLKTDFGIVSEKFIKK